MYPDCQMSPIRVRERSPTSPWRHTIRFSCVEDNFNRSPNSGAHAEYAYYKVISERVQASIGEVLTFVPHASDTTAAATTERILPVRCTRRPDIVAGGGFVRPDHFDGSIVELRE